jgi:hypothetical protein
MPDSCAVKAYETNSSVHSSRRQFETGNVLSRLARCVGQRTIAIAFVHIVILRWTSRYLPDRFQPLPLLFVLTRTGFNSCSRPSISLRSAAKDRERSEGPREIRWEADGQQRPVPHPFHSFIVKWVGSDTARRAFDFAFGFVVPTGCRPASAITDQLSPV